MITGAHAIIFTRDPEGLRAFVRDVLGFSAVDAGGGWLIFALPPAELAAHPAEDAGHHHELYLMCDDIQATVSELKQKGVESTRPISDEGWGLADRVRRPRRRGARAVRTAASKSAGVWQLTLVAP